MSGVRTNRRIKAQYSAEYLQEDLFYCAITHCKCQGLQPKRTWMTDSQWISYNGSGHIGINEMEGVEASERMNY
jgi:hypothetical protein